MAIKIHPLVDQGVKQGAAGFAGGTLTCRCTRDPVTVRVASNVAFNHVCGCTKCWKPEGALFSLVGVAGRDKVSVTANDKKLKIVDEKAAIQRYACTGCGVHMYGRIENKAHPFFGFDFFHVELSKESGWEAPALAELVSRTMESGFPPAPRGGVGAGRKGLKLGPTACLPPRPMRPLDALAPRPTD